MVEDQGACRRKRLSAQISTVFVEKHPPFHQHPAWILTLVPVLTPGQMDGSLDFSLLLRDALHRLLLIFDKIGISPNCMLRSMSARSFDQVKKEKVKMTGQNDL